MNPTEFAQQLKEQRSDLIAEWIAEASTPQLPQSVIRLEGYLLFTFDDGSQLGADYKMAPTEFMTEEQIKALTAVIQPRPRSTGRFSKRYEGRKKLRRKNPHFVVPLQTPVESAGGLDDFRFF